MGIGRISMLIASACLLAGCPDLDDSAAPVELAGVACPPRGSAVTVMNPAGPIRRRILLFHGVNSSHEMFLEPPFDEMSAALLDAGFQLVLMEVIDSRVSAECFAAEFVEHGAVYRHRWRARLEAALDDMDALYGPSVTIIGGFSLGGLHSLMGAELLPERFQGYFAFKPVVELARLSEYAAIDASRFDPRENPAALRAIPGFLSWADDDPRVGPDLTRALCPDVGATCASYPGTAHSTNPDGVSDLTDWLLSR